MAGRIIGLVGPIAGGKTAAAKALKDEGFKDFSLSRFVKKAAGVNRQMRRGADHPYLPLTAEEYAQFDRKEDYTATGILFRERLYPEIFARAVVDTIRMQWADGRLPRDKDIVIEGIRTPEEVLYLQRELGMYPIGVTAGDDPTAGQEERWRRVQIRQSEEHREGEPRTWEDFVADDNFELGEGFHIADALALCKEIGSLINNAGQEASYTGHEVLRILNGLGSLEGQPVQRERAC